MANFEGKTDESRKLIEGKSCAFDDLSKKKEDGLRKPVKMGLAYKDASKLFKEAQGMQPGPERDKKWRAAAVAYKVALEAAPERNEAPEAAMNGAYAYKQVGEYDKAIEMYELFISKYGSEENLKKLEKEDPAEYQRRVKFLKDAYDALAGSYVLFFDYPKAAETFDKISSIERFEQKDRRDAAQQALSLYSSLGDAGHMASSKKRFFALGASPKEQAEAEFIVANSDMKKWDANSPDEGANRTARVRATTSMANYHKRFAKKAPAAHVRGPRRRTTLHA